METYKMNVRDEKDLLFYLVNRLTRIKNCQEEKLDQLQDEFDHCDDPDQEEYYRTELTAADRLRDCIDQLLDSYHDVLEDLNDGVSPVVLCFKEEQK